SSPLPCPPPPSPLPSPPPRGERMPEGRVRGWFMVPRHAQKQKDAFQEPRGTSNIEHPTPNIARRCGKFLLATTLIHKRRLVGEEQRVRVFLPARERLA